MNLCEINGLISLNNIYKERIKIRKRVFEFQVLSQVYEQKYLKNIYIYCFDCFLLFFFNKEVTKDGLSFDHGAPFFTSQNNGLQSLVKEWQVRGLVAEWKENFGPLIVPPTSSLRPNKIRCIDFCRFFFSIKLFFPSDFFSKFCRPASSSMFFHSFKTWSEFLMVFLKVIFFTLSLNSLLNFSYLLVNIIEEES